MIGKLMLRLIAASLLWLGLLGCAANPQSEASCMTDEEIAAYRAKTGTSLNDAALRASCPEQ